MESHLRLVIKKVNEIWIQLMLRFAKRQAHKVLLLSKIGTRKVFFLQ